MPQNPALLVDRAAWADDSTGVLMRPAVRDSVIGVDEAQA